MVNQKDIINRLHEKTGFKKQDLKEMLSAFKDVIYEAMISNEGLILREVCTMKPIIAEGIELYIPSSKEYTYIPKHSRVKITTSRKLNEAVNENRLCSEDNNERDVILKQMAELKERLKMLDIE